MPGAPLEVYEGQDAVMKGELAKGPPRAPAATQPAGAK
jgi:hypothetical protein